jgi:hypothetical protein
MHDMSTKKHNLAASDRRSLIAATADAAALLTAAGASAEAVPGQTAGTKVVTEFLNHPWQVVHFTFLGACQGEKRQDRLLHIHGGHLRFVRSSRSGGTWIVKTDPNGPEFESDLQHVRPQVTGPAVHRTRAGECWWLIFVLRARGTGGAPRAVAVPPADSVPSPCNPPHD